MGNQNSSTTTNNTNSPSFDDYQNQNSTWRLFVCNAYLIPPFTVNKDNATCQHQDERAAALGRVLMKSKPDIFMLQEAWGAGLGALETEIKSNFSIGEYCRSWWGSTVVDSLLQYANARGGLYFGHNIKSCVNGNKISSDSNAAVKWRSYSTSKTKSKKGMVCVKYQKTFFDNEEESQKKKEPEIMTRAAMFKKQETNPERISTLLVFNTHLDPTNQDNVQLVQLGDLAKFIHDVVYEERVLYPEQDFSAVLVGDFNFTPSCPQYKELFKIMKKNGGVDLGEMLPEATKNVHTYAAKNPLVQWPSSCGRLDQIFSVKSVEFFEPNSKESIERMNKRTSSADFVAMQGDVEGRSTQVAEASAKATSYTLNPIQVVSEKVRDDVVVSDHYPFEIVFKC